MENRPPDATLCAICAGEERSAADLERLAATQPRYRMMIGNGDSPEVYGARAGGEGGVEVEKMLAARAAKRKEWAGR